MAGKKATTKKVSAKKTGSSKTTKEAAKMTQAKTKRMNAARKEPLNKDVVEATEGTIDMNDEIEDVGMSPKKGLAGAREAIKKANDDPRLTRNSARDFEKELLGEVDEEEEGMYEYDDQAIDEDDEYAEVKEGLPNWWQDSPAGIQAISDDDDDDGAESQSEIDDSDEWTEDDGWIED